MFAMPSTAGGVGIGRPCQHAQHRQNLHRRANTLMRGDFGACDQPHIPFTKRCCIQRPKLNVMKALNIELVAERIGTDEVSVPDQASGRGLLCRHQMADAQDLRE